MSLLTTLRQRALCRPHLPIQALSTRHAISRLAVRPQWLRQQPLQHIFKRLASNAAAAARTPRKYPSKINIYRSGTTITVFVGFLRLSTLVLFGIGTFMLAPSYFFSPDHSSLWVPVLIIGSSIPMLVAVFATGRVIHAITLHLPSQARRSVAELKRFADSPSGETILELHYMHLAPWMVSREVSFSRLRRVQPTLRGGSANLEYVPQHAVKDSGTVWFWLVQGFWARFYVKRDQAQDRAQVPGVLNKMWEHIPLKGSKEDPLVRALRGEVRERKVARMNKRPRVVSGREEALRRELMPPPLPPSSGKKSR